jgi:hypothetical protein
MLSERVVVDTRRLFHFALSRLAWVNLIESPP